MFKLSTQTVLVAATLSLLHVAPSAHAGGTPLTTEFVGGFSSPIEVTHAPGDFERIFVLERAGVIKIVKNGVIQSAPFLNITSQVDVFFERGLLGMDFHPDYDT